MSTVWNVLSFCSWDMIHLLTSWNMLSFYLLVERCLALFYWMEHVKLFSIVWNVNNFVFWLKHVTLFFLEPFEILYISDDWYQMTVYTQLNDETVLFLSIHFRTCHLFVHSLNSQLALIQLYIGILSMDQIEMFDI